MLFDRAHSISLVGLPHEWYPVLPESIVTCGKVGKEIQSQTFPNTSGNLPFKINPNIFARELWRLYRGMSAESVILVSDIKLILKNYDEKSSNAFKMQD
mmetsp:Transcript_12989/g.15765  ORF Transcript_12989/g.15765 Transcript_12989/m.15765 type:complete len:99 (-) Transcript_12989:138-434(-)